MPTALRKGLKVQRGAETTWGTPVAATAILAGVNEIYYGPRDTLEGRDELNGVLTATTGAPDVLGTSGMVYTGGYLTYQDFVYLLESAYKTSAGVSDAGSPPGYLYTYERGNVTEDTPKPVTLEAGGLSEAFRFPGSVLSNFEISAAIKGYTMFTATWISKDMVTNAFTGALTRRVVGRAKSQLWNVWIDSTWAGLGGTAVTSCITNIAYNSGDLNGFTNCIDGATTPHGVIMNPAQQPSLTLTFKLDTFTAGLFADYRAGSTKYMRLKNSGTTIIHDAVVPYIQLDLAGNLMEYPDVGRAVEENSLTIPLAFQGTYDETGAHMQIWKVLNALAAPA